MSLRRRSRSVVFCRSRLSLCCQAAPHHGAQWLTLDHREVYDPTDIRISTQQRCLTNCQSLIHPAIHSFRLTAAFSLPTCHSVFARRLVSENTRLWLSASFQTSVFSLNISCSFSVIRPTNTNVKLEIRPMAGNPRVACASIAWFLYDSALLFTDCNLAVVRAGLNAKL